MPTDLGSLGEAKVQIRAATDKLKQDMGSVESTITTAIKRIAAVAATYLSFRALTSTLKQAWEAAGRQAEALVQLEARIKSTGGAAGKSVAELQAMAAGLQQVTTYGDEAILAMQGVLLTFTNIKGDTVRQATEAILDLSAAMYGGTAGGLQQAAIQVGKALHDPIEGVTALRRVGILITEQQREQIKAMVDMGDVAGAQAIILKELQTEFGGTAKALRETPWGEAKALANTFGDMLEIIGGVIANKVHPQLKAMNIALEDFNATISKIGRPMEGFDIPTTEAELEKVNRALKNINASNWMGAANIEYLNDKYGKFRLELETHLNQLKAEMLLRQVQINRFDEINRQITELTSGSLDWANNLQKAIQLELLTKERDILKDILKIQDKLSEKIPPKPEIIEEYIDKLDRWDKENLDLIQSMMPLLDASERAIEIYRDTMTPLEKFSEGIDELNKLYEAGVLATETYNRAVAKLWEGFGQQGPLEIEKVEKAFDDMTEFAKQAARNIQNAFADFLFDPFDKGVKGMLESFMAAMRRMMANVMAKQILGAIPGLGTLLEAHGDVFSGGQVVPMARGAVISMPTLFPMQRGMGLMGEAGPEAVLPLKRTSGGDLGVKAQPANIRIVNAFADDHISDFMNSASGERVILNIIQRNAGTVQRLVGS